MGHRLFSRDNPVNELLCETLFTAARTFSNQTDCLALLALLLLSCVSRAARFINQSINRSISQSIVSRVCNRLLDLIDQFMGFVTFFTRVL